MKLVTWNVGHRKTRKPLVPDLARALTSAKPGVVVITDYLPDVSDTPFIDALAKAGLEHRMSSKQVKAQRTVLIASREPLTEGDIECCDLSTATRPNWLHVRTESGVDVVGFRVPIFTKRGMKQTYWEWLINEALPRLHEKPSVLLGDFNAAPSYRPLLLAVAAGWQLATPAAGWSHKTPKKEGTAIDHALVSPHFRVTSTEYVEKLGTMTLTGSPTAYSDHKALIVELGPREAVAAEGGPTK
jgi:exonuclease III